MTNTNESKWREFWIVASDQLNGQPPRIYSSEPKWLSRAVERHHVIEIGALTELRTQLAAAKEELRKVDRASIIAERRLYGDSSDKMDASQEASYYNWLDDQNKKLTEKLRVSELKLAKCKEQRNYLLKVEHNKTKSWKEEQGIQIARLDAKLEAEE